MTRKSTLEIISLIESYKIEDGVTFENGLPPSDVLLEVYRDLGSIRTTVNTILDAIIRDLRQETTIV